MILVSQEPPLVLNLYSKQLVSEKDLNLIYFKKHYFSSSSTDLFLKISHAETGHYLLKAFTFF